MEFKYNDQGGIIDKHYGSLNRAKDVDLVTLPKDIDGTNCYNCKWIREKTHSKGFCSNPRVSQYVTKRMCCAIWDSENAIRNFSGESPILKD